LSRGDLPLLALLRDLGNMDLQLLEDRQDLDNKDLPLLEDPLDLDNTDRLLLVYLAFLAHLVPRDNRVDLSYHVCSDDASSSADKVAHNVRQASRAKFVVFRYTQNYSFFA
jgi:hypothetical protein